MVPFSLFLRLLAATALCLLIAVLNGKYAESIKGPHMNDLNLLLPPRAFNPIRYRLQGTDGCFSWTWDHHEILSVIPEYNETSQCSASAHLISIAPFSGKKVTAVHASDIRSGQVIRCEVFIDRISRIQIFHHSVKLDLDGLATLRVHAFDDEDNVFSSLVGLRFTWQLVPVGSTSDVIPHRLVHVPLMDTHLSDCGGFCGDIATRIGLEESGVGSDLYVIRGIDIGRESVAVRLAEPELEHLSDTIVLTVAEAMSLEPPSPVFVIIGTRVHYTLKVLRRNKHEVVNLPSENHHWFVTNDSIALIDPVMGIVGAAAIGTTNIVVEDLRVAGHQQTAALHIVIPNELHLYLSLFTRLRGVLNGEDLVSSTTPWYFVVGREYVVHLKAFSWQSSAQPLYLTESNHLELQFDKSPYWNAFPVPEEIAVAHGWKNCSRLVAISEGQGKLSASLRYYSVNLHEVDQKLSVVPDMVISVVQEVRACEPVKINFSNRNEASQTLLLPWFPGVHQKIELAAKGGCGEMPKDYQWHSSDSGVLSVSASGVFQARRPGRAIIRVVAIVDLLNYDEMEVEVSVPSSMAMLELLPVEVAVGSQLPAAVTLRSSTGRLYSRCDAFNSFIRWQIFGAVHTFDVLNGTSWESFLGVMDAVGGTKLPNKKAPNVPVCAWKSLYASEPGKAALHAYLTGINKEFIDDIDAPVSLKVSWTVAAYAPLIVQQAGDGNSFGGYKFDVDFIERPLVDIQGIDRESLHELFLVPGSGMRILLHGGPERWRQGVEFVESSSVVAYDGKSQVKESIVITQLKEGGGRLHWISCHSLGNFTLTFKRGNLIGEDHPSPAIAKVELPIVCSIPSLITVIADEPANTLAIIRATSEADHFADHVRVTPITVTNGRTIRVAAVGIHHSGNPFANSSTFLLNWELSGCEQLAYWDTDDKVGRKTEAGSWERLLVLRNVSGQCIVRATLVGLSDSSLSSIKGLREALEGHFVYGLTDAVRLQLVSVLRIEPDYVILFFHPDSKASLSILGGTSDVKAIVNDTKVAAVVEEPPKAHYMHLVVAARGLGTAMVTVQDIGLASPTSVFALVHVADVDWIKLLLPEETSIQLGSIKAVEVVAGMHDGHVFDSSQIEFMNVHVHVEDEVLDLVNDDGTQKQSNSKVTGSKLFIRGASIGFTSTLHVSAWQASGREILSQFVKVEVYAPLRIQPARVSLAPGAKFTVTINGGPRTGIIAEYSSMNVAIASIDSVSGKLVGVSPGNSSIKARAYNSVGDFICEAYGTVNVQVPSSMSLNVVNIQLGIGRELSVFPKSTEGDLFSFYELCRNYKWTIEDEQVLAFRKNEAAHFKMRDISSLGEKGQHSLDFSDLSDAGFATRVIGRSAGRTTIGISFSCDFSPAGNNLQPVSYSASDTVLVAHNLPLALGMPITWLLPPFYTASNVLPEWTESSFRRDSRSHKGHIIYSVLKGNSTDDDSISIRGGSVKTSKRNTIGCIEAKDRMTGRFEIAACVRVAEISQFRIETEDFPFHVAELSVGTHQHLNITYLDDLGNPFFQAHGAVPLLVDTDHPEVVSVKVTGVESKGISTIGSFYVQALQQGRALVRLTFQDNPQQSEFILIRVGAYISPRNPVLHVGSHHNFSITGKGLHGGEHGYWSSANEGIVVIDYRSGEAQAVGEGVTQVMFRSTRLTTYTTVTVVRVASIRVSSPYGSLTNVHIPDAGYNFSVKISDFEGHSFKALGEELEVSYDCRVDPSYIGHCKPWRDSVTGTLYCSFIPYTPEHLSHILPVLKDSRQNFKVGDRDGILHISIIAALRGAEEVSGSADVIFKGGFSVPDAHELSLTPNTNKSRITIVGSAGGVKLHWQGKDFMSVSPVIYHALGVGGRAVYEVKVLKRESFTDKLEIRLPTTGQRMEISVSYEPGKFSGSNISLEVIAATVIVSVVLLVLTIIIYLRLLDQPEPRGQTGLNFGTEPAPEIPSVVEGTPRTPVVASNNFHTPSPSQALPRTPPQEYTQYIRKTMDDTPHFRRDRRKRFDPSYTY